MPESYFVHSNRQHESNVDFDRLFDQIGVAATFADKEDWGEQLRELSEGDQVLMYDQPSGKYIAAGTVDEPWDGSAITDPDKQVAPESESDEFHVGIDWEYWCYPEDGYERELVNQALGYSDRHAPQQAVFPIDNPSEEDIEWVYSTMAQGRELNSPLSEVQEEVLEKWREVAQSQPSGAEFDFANHDRTQTISDYADEFISNPSEEPFKSMWDRMHAAIRRGKADRMLDKWDGSIDELGELIREIRDAEHYDPDWEDKLGGQTTVRELFGSLHIERYPILNSAAEEGLSFFGYSEPDSYSDGAENFTEFLREYKRIVGHATDEADHGVAVPIRLEIDQLFNVIDKVDKSSIENESSEEAIELYNSILAAKGELEEEDGFSETSLFEIGNEDASAFWVNQENQSEIQDEYLRAKVDDRWHHDLGQISSGDIIFHNFDGDLIGVSTATDQSETYSFRGEEYQRVWVDLNWFEEPLPVTDSLKEELGRDEFKLEEYYPIDKNDNLKQAYLSILSEEAANFLLQQTNLEETSDEDEIEIPSKPADADEIERQLKQKKQVVFYGPPGTGKTYRAERFAKWWVAQQDVDIPVSDRVETVTFHPSFTYEDFIEGLTVESTDDGVLEYEVQDGILKQLQDIAEEAYEVNITDANNEAPRFVLVIDEINRGNLAQIFGETITLLEADKRGTTKVRLAHSGDKEFTLPPNLYIIGTMNTADRSIALVDAALRRRFRFFDIPPAVDVLYEEYGISSADDVDEILGEEPTPLEVLQALSIRAWERMNENILDSPDLGKGKQVGHSYLMGLDDPTSVKDAWRYDILPLLEEYHFGQFNRIKQEIFDGTSDPLIDPDTERIKSFTVQDLVDALSDFIGVDIETDFSDIEKSVSVGEESSDSSAEGFPKYPDALRAAQQEIFDRASDLLGAEEISDVSHEDVHRRSLRFDSTKEYIPDSVQFVFKPEPERHEQMIIHVNSEDEEDRVSDVLSAHSQEFEEHSFEVTDSSTYRIVKRTWPLDDATSRDGEEVVNELRDSERWDEAIDAFIDLIRITDSVFQDSEFAEGSIESTD